MAKCKPSKKAKKYQGGGPLDWRDYPDDHNTGGEGVGTDTPVPVDPTQMEGGPWAMAYPFFKQFMEGSMGEKDARQRDIFNPIQGFHGYNYQLGGNVNTTGYTPGFASFHNDENVIPLGVSETITMKDTPFPILAIPDVGDPVVLKPGETRKFKGAKYVREIPMKDKATFQMGGGIPQTQQPQQEEVPNKFNNQEEDTFNLSSFLPFLLDDPRNTANAGNRPLKEIQTEKGEYIGSPLGDLVKVAAKVKHKNMEDDDVTDITAEGNYIFSNDKNMVIKKGKDGGEVSGVKLEDIVMGYDPLYYKEGEITLTPEKYTLQDIAPNKTKYTFAELADSLAKKFPVTDREKDPFATRAIVENKLSRKPYIQEIIKLNEMKRTGNKPQKFQQGGFAGMAKKYSLMNPSFNQLTDAAVTGMFFPEDPLLSQLKKKDNAISYNRDMTKMPTTLNNKMLKFRRGGNIPRYQTGGYQFDDREKGQNKREQWNYWMSQGQDMMNDFTYNRAIPSLQGQSLFQALGILGQSAYQGDNEYLYGNKYNAKLDNLKNAQDRSFGSESAYYAGLLDRENSAMRLGMSSGMDPNKLVGMRGNAIREQNSQIANLGKERRSYADRYGSMDLNATDMFAGRQNQQKAYLNDFTNSKVQNLATVGSGYLANKTAAEGSALAANMQLQFGKQPGNGWTDFTNGLGDFINAITGIVGAFSGLGGGGGNGGNNANSSDAYGNPFNAGGAYQPTPNWGPSGQFGMPTYGGFNNPLVAPPSNGRGNSWGWNGG